MPGAPIDIPSFQQDQGRPLDDVPADIDATVRDQCGGEVCIEITVEVTDDGFTECEFVATDPPQGSRIERGGTLLVIAESEPCEDEGTEGEGTGNEETESETTRRLPHARPGRAVRPAGRRRPSHRRGPVLRAVLAGRLGGRTLPTWLPLALSGAGVVLCANGLSRVRVTTPFNRPLAVAPVSLAAGIVSLAAAVRMATATQPHSEVLGLVEYGIIFLLVGLSLFWAAADYSAAVGRSRAAQFVREDRREWG